eukprot:5249619-Prorocentrum_lima.AAC.1
MTSSLVGSEMCIRDRYSDNPKTIQALGVANWFHLRAPHPHWSGSADPVSYTHLTLPTICSV